MSPDQFDQLRMNRAPDRRPRHQDPATPGHWGSARSHRLFTLSHIQRNFYPQVKPLRRAGIDDRDRPVARRICGRFELIQNLRCRVFLRLASLAFFLAAFPAVPPKNRATSSSGRCVAEKGRSTAVSSRTDAQSLSRESARCEPRFPGTSA